jgi:hypothetical protein
MIYCPLSVKEADNVSEARMNVRSLFVVAISLIAVTLPIDGVAKGWEPFSFSEGSFSVEMPGKPSYRTKSDHTPVGKIEEHIYEYKNDKLTLSAEYSDLPGIAVIFGGTKKIYRKSKEAFLEGVKGSEVSFEPFDYEGYPAMKLVYNTETRRGRVHLILVKRRLYFLQGSVLKNAKDENDIDTFLKSFKQQYRKGRQTRHADKNRLGDWRH